eukprot:7428067-Pyramimonas_sp.AAC.2
MDLRAALLLLFSFAVSCDGRLMLIDTPTNSSVSVDSASEPWEYMMLVQQWPVELCAMSVGSLLVPSST